MYTRGGISSIDQSNNLYFLVVHRRLAPPPDAYGTLRGILNPRARATKPEREHTGVSRVNPTLNTHTRSSKKTKAKSNTRLRFVPEDLKVLCMHKQ